MKVTTRAVVYLVSCGTCTWSRLCADESGAQAAARVHARLHWAKHQRCELRE